MVHEQLQEILSNELSRQQDELELIASENYVSKDVLNAYANVFTNKYSEGIPGARYYGGQKYVDQLELYTQRRALQIFDLWQGDIDGEVSADMFANQIRGVNVQPLSGSPANLAVYLGVLKPGDTVLAMDLQAGGHLSHGHPLNSSAIYYNFVPYGVKQDTLGIDYDEIRSKALEYKPTIILAGFSAYPKNIDWDRFATIADEVSNVHGYRPLLMADIAHIAGLIAGGVLSSPFSYFDIITTTTHKTLRGPRGAMIYFRRGERDEKGTYTLANLDSGKKTSAGKQNIEKQINRGVFPGLQGGPHEHEIFAKAVALDEVLQDSYKIYVKDVVYNAKLLAEELSILGWTILTGSTENHIVLLDVTKKLDNGKYRDTGLTGKIAEKILESIGISVNKNLLPFDTRSAMDPSGLRLGTPAITTRGLGDEEIKQLAKIISQALENYTDDVTLQNLHEEVIALCQKFPLRY